MFLFSCASKPVVSFSVKNINGSSLTCLKSEVPKDLDLDKMSLTELQKSQCFLERCYTENAAKICTKVGNQNVLTEFKNQ